MSEQEFRNIERKPKYFTKDDLVQGPKKFVFQIQPENVKYIEDLSYQEKQDFINQLITNDRLASSENYNKDLFWKKVRKFGIIAAIIFIVIPVTIVLLNFMVGATQRSYHEMEQNFAKLYH